MNHHEHEGPHSGWARFAPQGRIFASLLTISLLGLAVALAFDAYRQYQAKLVECQETVEIARKASLQQVTEFLEKSRALLIQLTDDNTMRARVFKRCSDVLDEVRRTHPIFSNLVALDAKGQVVCEAMIGSHGKTSDSDLTATFHRIVGPGKLVVGKPVQDSSSDRWIARLLYPLKDDKGKPEGALALSIDLLSLGVMGFTKEQQAKLVVGIMNEDRTIVARSQDGLLRIGQTANGDVAHKVVLEREGTASGLDFLGVNRLFSYGPVPDSDWIVFANIDLDDATAAASRFVMKRLVEIVVLIFVAAGVMVMLWKKRT